MQTDIFEMGANAGGSGRSNRLPRTQTVSVRLDPKLRYLCEIAARKQRRTISSFIEWSLETSLDSLKLTDVRGNTETLGQNASYLWDVEPADRFAKLALWYPDLLNHHEEIVWKLIRENGYLWKGAYGKTTKRWTWTVSPTEIIYERLREHWDAFNRVARGDAPKTELPVWQEKELPSSLHKMLAVLDEPRHPLDEPPDPEDDLPE
jgi:hypothetical protein